MNTKREKLRWSAGLSFGCLFLLLFSSIVFSHPPQFHVNLGTEVEIQGDIVQCLSFLDKQRKECYESMCEPGYECAETLIKLATDEKGPVAGMQVLTELFEDKRFEISSDGHELAHIVGRRTALASGSSGEGFLACPSEYNYGCQHGFFEHALATSGSNINAATTVCENLPPTFPQKDKFYCYHGVGHGFMMGLAYNLDESLSVCDLLPNLAAQEGCWQGVFMENANGVMLGEVREGVFSEEDPLAPCNQVEEKYQRQCYLNHAGYMMQKMGNDIKGTSTACLNALPSMIPFCLQSLGLMTTNPGWQKEIIAFIEEKTGKSFLSEKEKKGDEFLVAAVKVCDTFPKDYIIECYDASIDNLANFDQTETKRAHRFCSLLEHQHKKRCYQRVGANLNAQVTSLEDKKKGCLPSPPEFFEDCFTGFPFQETITIPQKPTTTSKNFVPVVRTKEEKKVRNFDAFFSSFFLIYMGVPETILWWVMKEMPEKASIEKKITAQKEKIDDIKDKKKLTDAKDSNKILIDNEYTAQLIRKYTLKSVTASLDRVSHNEGVNCHSRAHELGRLAYEIMGSTAFSQCGNHCHSGCRHGATEAFFRDKGTATLKRDLNLLCEPTLTGFFSHQCLHGVGHGLMAWTDYDLPAALQSCDLLGGSSAQESCHSGVFMENIVGGLATEIGHFTSYLNEDPHFPCTVVDDKYKSACYFLQTDRMFYLLGNFEEVGKECSKAPQEYQHSCFGSLGRTISGGRTDRSKESIEMCKKIEVKEGADECIVGVLLDHFWDETQAEGAKRFCTYLKGMDIEERCYDIISQRAVDILSSEEKDAFCSSLPKPYQENCDNTQESPARTTKESDGIDEPKEERAVFSNEPVRIVYRDGKYEPRSIIIAKGQEVVWVNEDEGFWPASNIHPTHTVYPESNINDCGTSKAPHMFDACNILGKGETFSLTFTHPGIWRYHDHINPEAGGTVVVQGEGETSVNEGKKRMPIIRKEQNDARGPKGDVRISYTYGKFNPEKMIIKVGQTVEWINEDKEEYFWPASNDHPIHTLYSEFDAKKPIPPGGVYSFTFTRKGEWDFHDHLTPRAGGVVVVE